MKFLHTLATCGLIGGLLVYGLLLIYAPQDTPQRYADLRHSISLLASYILLPSLALALVTGLLSMVVHRPFQEKRWVWVKALLGIGMFEATLAVIGSKADYAAKISAKIASGEADAALLQTALASEWSSLGAVMAISVANVILGVWRPKLKRQNPAGA